MAGQKRKKERKKAKGKHMMFFSLIYWWDGCPGGNWKDFGARLVKLILYSFFSNVRSN